MTDPSTATITGYHAHVYFDAQTIDRARALCEIAHPDFREELAASAEKLA